MEEILIPFFAFGVIVAGLIGFAYLIKFAEIRQARKWMTTKGRVVKSQVRNRKRTDMDGKSRFESEPHVTDEYEVAGKTYRGSRVSFAERIAGVDVQTILKRYPVGAIVVVYYDSCDPDEAVLERVMPDVVSKGVGGIGAFILGAVIILPLIISFQTRWLAAHIPNPERALFIVLITGLGLAIHIFTYVLWRQASGTRTWNSAPGRVLSTKAEKYSLLLSPCHVALNCCYGRKIRTHSLSLEDC